MRGVCFFFVFFLFLFFSFGDELQAKFAKFAKFVLRLLNSHLNDQKIVVVLHSLSSLWILNCTFMRTSKYTLGYTHAHLHISNECTLRNIALQNKHQSRTDELIHFNIQNK